MNNNQCRIFSLVAAAALGAAAPSLAVAQGLDGAVAQAKAAMMSDPARALRHAQVAERAALAERDPKARPRAIAVSLWLQAEARSRLDDPAGAQPLVERGLSLLESAKDDTKLRADLLMTRAAISTMKADVQGALSDLHVAHNIFGKVGERRSQALALQDIGSIYAEAGDYQRALDYYRQSTQLYTDDSALTMSLRNNMGMTYREMGRYAEARREYNIALSLTRTAKSPFLQANVLANLAQVEIQSGRGAVAESRLKAAMQLTELEEAAVLKPFIHGVKAQLAYAKGDQASAIADIGLAFADQNIRATTLPYREFHETAHKIYRKAGDLPRAIAHLEAFQRLNEEARELKASTNAALMSAKFDFANQEVRLAQRNADLARSEARLNATQFYSLVVALALALLILVISMFASMRIRRSRDEVQEANQSLSRTNEALMQAISAKSRFLATTSHEIRTPLNGILGMTQVMLQDRTLQEDHRDRVRIVHEAGATMKALVDDILDLAKLETGKVSLIEETIELRPLLEGVARLWTGQAAAKGLGLEVDLAHCPARVRGDSRRLRQVVFNLMSNAVKFTEVGYIRLRAHAVDNRLVLSVEDTGIGIPDDQLAAVFESFHQVDGDLGRRYGGTGLGLAICRDLVKAMGGSIHIQSAVGEGSTFVLDLPLIAVLEAAEAGDASAEWPSDLRSASAIVVENNPLTRSIMAASLKPHFARVDTIGADGADIPRGVYHHVIVDHASAGHQGCESAARLAFGEGQNALITLLSSERLPAEEYSLWVRHGVRQVLQRPLSVEALLAALREAHESATAGRPALASTDRKATAAAA